MSSIEIDYKTRIEGQLEINTIEWTVPDFIKLLENKTTRELRTEKLKDPADLSESRIQLKMHFLGWDTPIIDIYYLSATTDISKITFEIFGRYQFTSGFKECHTVQVNKWQYLTTLFKEDIVRTLSLEHKILTLKFIFFVKSDIKVDRFNIPQMSNDFENLLNIGWFSDVTIKSAEQLEFKVHKAVLTSRSPVLKAHFEHNTTECHTDIVESPLDSEVLREVLTFVYSDKAPRVDEIPEKLLAAADYYMLSGLKSLCGEALHKKVTVENAIETLQLAILHSANALKQLTLEFIKDQSKVITKTDAWSKVKDVELIKMICEYIVADDIDADIK